MKTALYRHFDAAGRLLYVGISLNALQRLGQHSYGAAWFDHIATVTIEQHPTRGDALTAEAIAIAKESPLWNIVRPSVYVRFRNAPIESDTADVKVLGIGEDLHPVLWAGKQWAVTEYGIEARDGTYAIQASRLHEGEPGYSWERHMRDKQWVDVCDFRRAFLVACWIHLGEHSAVKKLHEMSGVV